MKILLTNVGRRAELTQVFRIASKRLEVELENYGVKSIGSAPALYFCNKTVMEKNS